MLVSLLGWDFLSTKFTLQLRHLRCLGTWFSVQEIRKHHVHFSRSLLHLKLETILEHITLEHLSIIKKTISWMVNVVLKYTEVCVLNYYFKMIF